MLSSLKESMNVGVEDTNTEFWMISLIAISATDWRAGGKVSSLFQYRRGRLGDNVNASRHWSKIIVLFFNT